MFPPSGFCDEGIVTLLEGQKEEVWSQLQQAEVHNLYRIQAQAQVIERMLSEARDRISASTGQKRR